MSTLQPVRGTRDFLPDDYRLYHAIVEKAGKTAELYGFEAVATPIMEKSEVFQHNLGETSDIVSKEMYELVSRGEDRIVLRPENTASIVRAVISNGLTQSFPLKYFYAGPMFRYERPQKGRYRQFHQFGVELLDPQKQNSIGDVEMIAMAYHILKALGLADRVTLELNSLGDRESRRHYREALVSYLAPFRSHLSPESQNRLDRNPLRILDSKDPRDHEILQGSPRLYDCLTEESHRILAEVRQGLETLGIPYKENLCLVRGLDYYHHIIFEFTTNELGAQSAVLAGGRYTLAGLGGAEIAGVGWAAGIERLMMMVDQGLCKKKHPHLAWITEAEGNFLINDVSLVEGLRELGLPTELYVGSFSKSLSKAAKRGAAFALFRSNVDSQIIIKDMSSGEQHSLPDKGNYCVQGRQQYCEQYIAPYLTEKGFLKEI